eukprot:g1447.t1
MERRLVRQSLKRAENMFEKEKDRYYVVTSNEKKADDEHVVPSEKVKIACKFNDEYAFYESKNERKRRGEDSREGERTEDAGDASIDAAVRELESQQAFKRKREESMAVVKYTKQQKTRETESRFLPKSQAHAIALRRKMQNTVKKPQWHPRWKLMKVVSGHLGWVRSIAVEPGNQWFATGAGDRLIKIWDLASCKLKLTLTGHIHAVRALQVSDRHPYLFSAGEDKMVKCWDLERNECIRHYYGHMNGVYSMMLHPTLDLLVTGGRDSVARLWDMRTKHEIMCLSGHTDTVGAVLAQGADPQVVTGSMDKTMRLWDIRKGSAYVTLTHHKKGVRALVGHPREFTMASAAADSVKKWLFPKGKLLKNMRGHGGAIVNSLAVNNDNVLVSCGDDGAMRFWDWKSGYCFQKSQTVPQPGSLESECAIYACTFDRSGSRLLTCEADKTIKVYKEDEDSTEETDPIDMKSWALECRTRKAY